MPFVGLIKLRGEYEMSLSTLIVNITNNTCVYILQYTRSCFNDVLNY